MASTEFEDIEDTRLARSDAPAAIAQLDHVALAVEDLEGSIEWYVRSLGFEFVERRTTVGERTAMHSAVLQAGHALVVLTQGTSPESQVSRFIEHHGPGVTHIAFAVRNLDAVLARLQANRGHAATPVMEDVGIRQVFLQRDSKSGVRIELIERNGGNFTDQSVELLFRTFERLDLY